MAKKVIIIGSGIGGIATANLLQKAGYEVHVYEKNAQLGGRAGQKMRRGFTFDTGPSWYLMPEVFKQYFALFDRSVDAELGVKRLSPAYKVFYESRGPLTITGNLTKDKKLFESIEAGAGESLTKYVAASTKIYRLALKHFLYTDFRRPHHLLKKDILTQAPSLFRYLTTPIHRHVSQYVKTPALQQILEYPMVFLGSSPFTAPAMYSLMSSLDFEEGVFYPKKGMYSIIELLVSIGRELGVSYHTRANVTKILHRDGAATGVRLATNKTIEANIVISNADLHHTETKLLPKSLQTYPASYWAKKEAGISALLLYIGVKGKLPQLEHHNLFFVDAWRDNFEAIYDKKKIPQSASIYVSRTTATDPGTAPKNHENIFMLVPLPTGLGLGKSQQVRLAERFIDQLAKSIQQPDLKNRIVFKEIFGPREFRDQFHAWQGSALGMSHRLTQSAFWRTPNQSRTLKNLYYVGGNTMPGVGLPMCLISAELVFKRITGDKKSGPITEIRT